MVHRLHKLGRTTALAFGALLVALSAPGVAADPLTKEQGEEILRELREIKALLKDGKAAPKPPAEPRILSIGVREAPSLGAADAPVVMVEFVDYQCGYCRRYHVSTFDSLRKRYVESGKVRYVVKDLPLPFHGQARGAALAARCVADLGGREAYWRMADALFINQAKLSAELIERLAGEQGVDPTRLGACAADKKTAERIDADVQEASRVGITGTPSFVIGTAKGDIVTGTLVVGAQAEANFSARIEDALKKAEPAR
jgi:protein-disulfide isomerase